MHKLASFFAGGRPSVFGFIPLPLSLSVVKTFPKLVSFRLLYHVVHKRERERDGGEGGIYVCDVGTHVHTCSSASCHWCPYTYICSLQYCTPRLLNLPKITFPIMLLIHFKGMAKEIVTTSSCYVPMGSKT